MRYQISRRRLTAALLAGVIAASLLSTLDASAESGPRAIAVSATHSCAVAADRTVKCWGANNQGQLGNGVHEPYRTSPVLVGNINNATDVAVGTGFSCAQLTDSTVKCWGANTYGQLGNGTTSPNAVAAPVPGIDNVLQISAGSGHVCVDRYDRSTWCWGRNTDGQLGDGTRTNRTRPVQVSGMDGTTPSGRVIDIALGERHSCAATFDGRVRCWGHNINGQLGDGTVTPRVTPTVVKGITFTYRAKVQLSAGTNHSCVTEAPYWYPPPTTLPTTTSTTTTTLPGPTTTVVPNTWDNMAMLCWGSNVNGMLGDAQLSANRSLTPVRVDYLDRPSDPAAGGAHSCAVTVTGGAACWGTNTYGQLGNGTTVNSRRPVVVASLSAVSMIASAANHNCALTTTVVRCWGANSSGQLGTGTRNNSSVPVAVPV